jgi:16S rRNA (cytidine1402-2'-O)-methyltransferase
MPMDKLLYLLPVELSDSPEGALPAYRYTDLVDNVKTFFVENLRSARRHLRKFGYKGDLNHQNWIVLEENPAPALIIEALRGITPDSPGAILSEAGMPAIADPGSEVVAIAHETGIRVIPIPGSSSLFLALAASGLNGQHFIFHGYLPVSEPERSKRLRYLEQQALQTGYTQIFMETPYRNRNLFESICKVLHDDTRLCIAADITGSDEMIKTMRIQKWRTRKPEIHKIPAVFLLNT